MAQKKKLWKLMPVVRAIGVLSAVGIATTLVTFAAIQSTGSALTGNTIQTATANLQISTSGSAYSDNVPGFTFSGLVPGGAAQPIGNGYAVYLKNVGTASVKLALTIPTPPSVTGNVDLSKVTLQLTPIVNLGAPSLPMQQILLSDLVAGQVNIDNSTLAVNSAESFHVQVQMSTDAVTGNSATISNLNLSFSGIAQ